MGLKESKLSMFSNGGSTPPSVVTDKKDTIEVEKVEDEAKNDEETLSLTNIGFRVQDLLTLGLIGWTVYLVGDSIRIVAFPPPQI